MAAKCFNCSLLVVSWLLLMSQMPASAQAPLVKGAVIPLKTGTIAERTTWYSTHTVSTGDTWYVTDAVTSADCVTGSGAAGAACLYDGSTWIPLGSGATITAGDDTEVPYFDTGVLVSDPSFTFDVSTGVAATTGGFQSACDPTTDADRCDDTAVMDSVGNPPDSPASGTVQYKWIDSGTDAHLSYIGSGYSVQYVQREPYTVVSTAASETLTNEQCWRATVVNSDADAMTVNLCATPRIGSIVCVMNTAAGALTVNPDNADSIQMNGTNTSAGEAVVSNASADVDACFFAVTTGLWKMSKGAGTWAEETP